MDAEAILKELIKLDMLPDERNTRRKQLSEYLNDLLLHNFPQLVQLLYRVDVSEVLLKATLKQNPTKDAGELIADLLLQRQREKLAARNTHRFSTGASDEERW